MALITGIDPGTCSIKIVQGTMNGPLFKLTRAVRIPVNPSDDLEAEVLRALQSSLKELKLKPGITRLGVTGRALMMRYTQVPPVPLWRLRMLMDFEVGDMSQSSGEPLVADYNLLVQGGADDDETVLVSLVKSRFLENRTVAVTQGGGIGLHAATPNCIALFNSFLAFGEPEEEDCTFLLDIGDQNLEMAVAYQGELVFARNLSGGGDMFTDAIRESWDIGTPKARDLKHDLGNVTPRGQASYTSSNEEKVANAIMGVAGQLAGMVQSTINFSRSQSGMRDMKVGRIIMSGGGSNLQGLDTYLQQQLNIPVLKFQPDAGLDLSGLSLLEREEFEEDPSVFVCALGLARMSQDEEAFVIDLVPEGVKKRRKFLGRTLYVALAGVAAAVFLAILWMDLSDQRKTVRDQRLREKRSERSAVNIRKKYDKKVREASLMRDKVNRLAWESRPGTFLVRAQGLLQKSAPASTWISSVEVVRRSVSPPGSETDRKAAVEKVVVNVKGRVWGLGKKVRQTYTDFLEALRADDLKPVIVSSRDPDRDGAEFELQIDFSGWPAVVSEEVGEEQ